MLPDEGPVVLLVLCPFLTQIVRRGVHALELSLSDQGSRRVLFGTLFGI